MLVPAGSEEFVADAWSDHLAGLMFSSPEEIVGETGYAEGALMRVEVNRYERDRRARLACIAHWGNILCGM